MGRWIIETRAGQQMLTHYCECYRHRDTNQVLRQDIGGGHIRCDRCGESFLPESLPGNPRLLLCIRDSIETQAVVSTAMDTVPLS